MFKKLMSKETIRQSCGAGNKQNQEFDFDRQEHAVIYEGQSKITKPYLITF